MIPLADKGNESPSVRGRTQKPNGPLKTKVN